MKELELLDDNELAMRAKEEGGETLNFLVRKFMPNVTKVARRFFLIGAEHEDLIQEGLIGLLNAVASFDVKKEASFKTFSNLCIKRNILSAIKHYNTKKNKNLSDCLSLDLTGGVKSEGGDEDGLVFVIPSSAPLVDDSLIIKEKLEEVKEFIKKNLSGYEKKVLAFYLDGKSYSDIAKEIDKTPQSVENALSRIRAKLSPLR